MRVTIYNHKRMFELLLSLTLVDALIGWLVIVSWGTVTVEFEFMKRGYEQDKNN